MIRFSTGLRNAILGDTGFQSVFQNSRIEIRAGAQPASADDAATGTLLGIVTVDAGAFTPGQPDNGLNFDDPADGTITKAAAESWEWLGLAAGVAGWWRLMTNAEDGEGDSTELPRVDGSIANSGADMLMVNVHIEVDAPDVVPMFRIRLPESNNA